jgi:ubiquinone/menaquinone biosynthesis C-methylase UbiE
MLFRRARRAGRRLRDRVWQRVAPVSYTRAQELAYWRGRLRQEGTLRGDHYAWVYTTFFGLEPADYAGRRLLDVGCGPRGSLEWATQAAERIGVDPLARAYRRLGTTRHAMRYVQAPAEALPFPADRFDIVSSYNALDHGQDPQGAARELVRVLRPGGWLLLLVEVNHPPTATEPLTVPWSVPTWFEPACAVQWQKAYEIGPVHDLYGQLRADARYDSRDRTDRPAFMAVKAQKQSAAVGVAGLPR